MSLFVSSKFTPIPILLSADLSATVAGDKPEVVLRNLTEQLSAFLRRATDFLHSKYMRRTLSSFTIITILIGIFVFVNPVKAEGLSDIMNGMINAVSYILIEIAGIFMQITIFALKFFIEIAGYNNFIDASIVKLGWNMVRDVANMFFVVILLVIAFGTILGLEQYEWKKTLAKLIMSAFLVNFSNLICQVIIDVSQVFTITFLNAIAGAAGGNLIKMFNFDEILQIAQRGTDPSGIQIELFGGAVMTIIFAGMAMATIGAYLVVMIARMVVLWTLMIMSPLAFLFAALPNTQSHAQEFWNQFTSQVIVAPVMVFFLWLAFATFGGGDIVQQDIEANHPLIADGGIRAVTESTDVNGNSLGITFSKAASWENMANFAVAIAFLWIGLERVQKLGVVGGGLVSGAMSFGKNVATIASGVALGRWMGRKGVEGAKAGMSLAGRGLYQGLAANRVEIIKNAIDRQIEGWGDWRGRGADPIFEDKRQAAGQLSEATTNKIEANGGPKDGDEGVNKEGNKVKYDSSRKGWYETDTSDKEGWKRERSKKTGEVVKAVALDKDGMPQLGPNTNNAVQKFFHGRQMALIASRKNLEKVKNQKKNREELMDKRVTAVPKYLMQAFEGPQPDAFDRMEQGMLEAEQMRSAAKTEEFKALGKALVLNSQREKDGQRQEGGTIAQQIAAHKTNAARNEGLAQKVQTQARRDYMRDKGTDVVRATMDAKLQVESSEAESKKLEASAMTGAILASERLGDKGALAQKIAAEKAEHSETVKQGLVEKREERRFLEGEHGQTEVREEAAFKAQAAATEAAIKRIEEQGEIDAIADVQKSGIADPFKQKIQEELEAARVAEQKKTAEAKLGLDVKESKEGLKTLQATEAAKLATSGFDAKQKEEEARAKNRAASADDSGIRLAAQAQMNTKAAEARTKQIETQANLELQNDPDYAELLKAQSNSKVLDDTLSSTEKEKMNAEMLKRMQEGLNAELEAQKILESAAKDAASQQEAIKKAKAKREGSASWAYAKAKALEDEMTSALSVTHNTLLNDVDQEVVGNPRGLQKPTTALTENIEKAGRQYRDMVYEQFVSNLKTNLKAMMAKRKSGQEVTAADKAEMAGLLMKGQEQNWIDDGIWTHMQDPELAKEMDKAFGWKDQEFDGWGKINDLMSIFATGGNMDFAKTHSKVGKMMDFAASAEVMGGEDNALGVDAFIKKLKAKSFSSTEIAALQAKMGPSVDVNAMMSSGEIDTYMKELDNNQAQLQFIANLRDKAAGSSHPENGGHGQFVSLGDGKFMYVLTGAQTARESTVGEVKKMDVGIRARMQTHATANIDEATGFVTTVRQDDMRDIRGSINSANDYRGTNERFDIQMLGLSSKEKKDTYKAKNGSLLVTGKNNKGVASKRRQWLEKSQKKEFFDKIKKDGGIGTLDAETAMQQATSNDIAEEIFAKRIRVNASDFLITMAKAAGIPEHDALAKGKMDVTMMVDGEEERITDINTYIKYYNEGKFNFGKIPTEQLASYSGSSEVKKEAPPSGGEPTPGPTPTPSGGGAKKGGGKKRK